MGLKGDSSQAKIFTKPKSVKEFYFSENIKNYHDVLDFDSDPWMYLEVKGTGSVI